jgi:hypothetical protein
MAGPDFDAVAAAAAESSVAGLITQATVGAVEAALVAQVTGSCCTTWTTR